MPCPDPAQRLDGCQLGELVRRSRRPQRVEETKAVLANLLRVIPTRVKADSFWGFQNGASHVHRPPGLGQCMILGAGWYKPLAWPHSLASERPRYAGRSARTTPPVPARGANPGPRPQGR